MRWKGRAAAVGAACLMAAGILACGAPEVEERARESPAEALAPSTNPVADETGEPAAAPGSERSRDYRTEVTARFLGGLQRDLTPAEVARVKAATVLVRSPRGSGSGFLFHRNGDGSHLVATNHHVVDGLEDFGSTLEVVLDSGSPGQEQVLAQVVAMDPDADLAVLKIPEPERPREVLSLAVDDAVFETQSIVVAGFPFGEILSRSGLPAPTLGKGSVSSLRHDDRGELFRVQLDADVNPGNSGGPVVSGGGQVVGVAVESVSATNISFMVPVSRLHDLLNGYVVALRYEVEGGARDKLVTIEFDTRDPMARISGFGVNLVASEGEITQVEAGEAVPRVGSELARTAPQGETTRLRVRVARQPSQARQPNDRVFLQPWFSNPRGGRNFAPFRVSLLDSGRQSGELKWNAEVEQGWSDDKPKWASGGGVPLTGDWLEPDPDAGDGTLAGDPEAIPDVIAQTSFAPKKTATVADATASLLLEDAENLLPHLLWSSDQNAFFALTKAGALHRVALDGFRETHRVRLFEEASAMAQSAMGLVVAVPGSQLVRVIAEDGLRTLRTIRVPGVSQLVSSPQLKVAYAADERSPWELSVVDLHRKRVARTYAAREVSQRFRHLIRRHPDGVVLSEFDALTVSPDGKYLFAEGFECLHRFRIKGTSLEYEEMGPRLGTGRIEISPDSKYLTMVGSLSSNAIKNHPRIKQGSLPIYRLENLQDPVRVVEVGIHPRALGFDVARGRLLGHDHNRPLVVLGSRSEPEREYALPVARNSRVRQILPHPVYSGALVLTDKELWWVGWG